MGDGSENYSGNEEEENELPQIPLNLAGPQEVNVDNSQVKIGNTVNVNFSVGNIVVKSEHPDQLLQGCSTQLPGNDLKQIIGEIVAQTIPRCLQDKSLAAITYNESCILEHNQNFRKEDKLICGESNSPVTYEKSASIASSHECKILKIDDSKASGSKEAAEKSKNRMKEFRKPLILWALPEFYKPDVKYIESSPITPPSLCLPENNHPKINYLESKIRETDDSEASCSTQMFSQTGETEVCHLKSKTLSSSRLLGNNHQETNYFESRVQETDDSEASSSKQILNTSNYKQIYNQTCLLKQYSKPQFSVTSSKHGEDIKESYSKQSGISKVLSTVEHEPYANPRSTSQTVDNTSLLKFLSTFDLQNLVINTFVEEVCSHFKANMIPLELGNIKTNLHIFITYIIKVFEVICKEGKLRTVGHIEMTRVTDFEKDNHGLSFNIEFSFKELIISFDNCHLYFLPILKVIFPGLYSNYEPVKKKLEIVIKECLIKTHFIITNVSKEIGRILDTNVYFLDNLAVKITSEDIDSNQENKIGEQYFEKYLQTHYSGILKNILLEIFSMSVNYVAGVNGTIFYNMIQDVFN